MGCDLCGDDTETIHLPLYVFGSEGIETCLQCRLVLTEVASGIRSASYKARKQGYLSGKMIRGVSGNED
jgi:hypothetical protein